MRQTCRQEERGQTDRRTDSKTGDQATQEPRRRLVNRLMQNHWVMMAELKTTNKAKTKISCRNTPSLSPTWRLTFPLGSAQQLMWLGEPEALIGFGSANRLQTDSADVTCQLDLLACLFSSELSFPQVESLVVKNPEPWWVYMVFTRFQKLIQVSVFTVGLAAVF